MNKIFIFLVLANILAVFISTNASALTRVCESKVKMEYSFGVNTLWGFSTGYRKKTTSLTDWGYLRKSSSPGSPTAARKRACEDSARSRLFYNSQIKNRLQNFCKKIPKKGFKVHRYYNHASAHSVDYTHKVKLDSVLNYDAKKNRTVWDCDFQKFIVESY